MTKAGRQALIRLATAASSAELAPKSPTTAKRRGSSGDAVTGLADPLSGPGAAGLLQAASASTARATRRVKSPLFCGREQISESAELGCFGHAGSILVVGGFLGILAKGAERKLGLAAPRIDLEHFGFQARAGRKVLAQVGAAFGAGVDETARLPPRRSHDAHDEPRRFGDHHRHFQDFVRS